MKRKNEYFGDYELTNRSAVTSNVRILFPQERDWTCAVACIRSLISCLDSVIPDETEFIETYKLTPGPHYSEDVKEKGMLKNYNAIYGHDMRDYDFDSILNYIKEGYFVMMECMYNYGHWMVLLGYYPVEYGNIESSSVLMYDPYYNQVRLLHTDEFISMWIDGDHANNGIKNDFIAIKA